jgi:aromatic amino acid aminotransferase I
MRPGYSDWQVLLNSGSTDGWSKVVSLICEKDEYILVEEHTFSSAQAFWAPICKAAPVAIDHEGLVPEDLENVLEHWDEKHPGSKRPHLYVRNSSF